ncbi:hypothetical protein CC86DRAFT_386822 [Ophiobolus disseminans]|uniref:F-box domain-containing protein n=1 Tax=Ophiobolus disseminans TaxID=1469910 RepID=A0A6A6ZIA4_9PLEO|nr:hypothetical protein CC86DRAFT_386822 [Ophiobolus disseminans]
MNRHRENTSITPFRYGDLPIELRSLICKHVPDVKIKHLAVEVEMQDELEPEYQALKLVWTTMSSVALLTTSRQVAADSRRHLERIDNLAPIRLISTLETLCSDILSSRVLELLITIDFSTDYDLRKIIAVLGRGAALSKCTKISAASKPIPCVEIAVYWSQSEHNMIAVHRAKKLFSILEGIRLCELRRANHIDTSLANHVVRVTLRLAMPSHDDVHEVDLQAPYWTQERRVPVFPSSTFQLGEHIYRKEWDDNWAEGERPQRCA